MWYKILGTKLRLWGVMFLALTSLAGCLNDSSDDSSSSYGTVQFYNASSNSSATRFLVDAELQSVASFGDASSRVSLEADTYDISIERTNTDDASDYIELLSEEVSVTNGSNRLFIMSGDFSDPTLTEYTFSPNEDLDTTELELMVFNVSETYPQLEIYYGATDGDQASATLLATLATGEQADFTTVDADDYLFYVVDASTGDTLLKTDTVPFTGGYSYFMIVRDDVINGGISLDQMTSSTFVYNYPNPEADAQLRAYVSDDSLSGVNISFQSSSETAKLDNVATDSLTDFITLPYGDYLMTITDAGTQEILLENKLVSLQAGAAKNILIYRNSSDTLVAKVYDQDMRERTYEHDINLISLADITDSDGDRYLLKAYFVNEDAGETKDTASQVITGIDYASLENFTLVAGNYSVYIIYTDEDDQENLLTEKTLLELEANTNYQLLIEPDAATYNGYRLSILH